METLGDKIIEVKKEKGFKNDFERLVHLDVRPFAEKREGGKDRKTGKAIMLDYLSWAVAWELVKREDENATFEYVEAENGLPCFPFGDHMFVKTSVTFKGQTQTMWSSVMDYRNNSMNNPTPRDICDALARCLVKNIALFGIGLSLYQKEGKQHFEPTQEQQNMMMSLISTIYGQNQAAFVNDLKIWIGHANFTGFSNFSREEADIVIESMKEKLKQLQTQKQETKENLKEENSTESSKGLTIPEEMYRFIYETSQTIAKSNPTFFTNDLPKFLQETLKFKSTNLRQLTVEQGETLANWLKTQAK